MPQRVNIRPGVRILSVLRHLNYKPWFALAEFVDNSLQSFMTNRDAIRSLHGTDLKCRVAIRLESELGRLTIRDNAAGIASRDYDRAFRAAELPPDRTGLSEFGMGMKSAACWFAPSWEVRTSALGEATENVIRFNIVDIVSESMEQLEVTSASAELRLHFTEIVLADLYKPPQGATVKKIKDHLASIYRRFIANGDLELTFNDDVLAYATPSILLAQKHDVADGPSLTWRKEIDFDFGLGLKAKGFAALRERGSTSEAGFALFRRGRLIEGSADDGYRPELIFGKSNSYRYQRLFGELELEGFEITHTKDGFRWDENEEPFLHALREELESEDLPLLSQAEQYRARFTRENAVVRYAASAATQRTGDIIQRDVPPVLGRLNEAPPDETPAAALTPGVPLSDRLIEVRLGGQQWRIVLEVTDDPAVGDWVEISDSVQTEGSRDVDEIRSVGVRFSLSHPFTVRFAGSDGGSLEPLLRLAAAIGLAEIAARSSGVRGAGTVRRNINELLRSALSNE